MNNRRVRTLLLAVCTFAVLALRAVPASSSSVCATKCGSYFYKGMLCFNCCTCCVLIDGSIDCICSADCEPF
jgi:hypothetical protein